MKSPALAPVVCLLAAPWLAGSQDPQPPAFRTGANTVAVYATVTDGQRLVTDLPREAFEVRDGGRPQPITVFSTDPQPLRVVMMLDRSGSMRQNFRLVEAAGEAFVRRLQPGDLARIGSFAERVEIFPADFTDDQRELVRILRDEMQEMGPTPLWNAVDAAITALSGQDGRRVVLVFSDGGDAPMNFRLRNRSIMDVMRRAQQEDVMVYSIGLQSTLLRMPGQGGGYFELNRAEDLAATFERVAEELRHQYLLGFEPTVLDNRMKKLDVRVAGRGMKVRARREYFAAR